MDYEFNQIIFDEHIKDVIVRMQRAAIRKGIKASVLEDSNKPWSEKLLILEGVKVMFTPSYDMDRCTLEAVVFDKKKIDPKFKTLWDQFQKESLEEIEEASVEALGSAESALLDGEIPKKHWEVFEKEEDKKKVFLFLTTDIKVRDLSIILGIGNLSVDIAKLRAVEKIPVGQSGRKEYKKKWDNYLEANKAEREKYEELRRRYIKD